MGVLLWISIRGLRPSVWVQTTLIVIEYASVISFLILALIHEASHAGGASLPSWSDFSFGSNIGGIRGVANAGVTCAVLYAGWEAAAVVGEESTKPRQNPGRAMVASVAFLIIWFTVLIMVFQGITNQKTLLTHGGDVLAYAGSLLAPGLAGRILPLAVLIAVIGTTQLQMTESSRLLYAFARDRLLPGFLGKISQQHQTPWAALVVLGLIPPVFLIPYLASSSFFKVLRQCLHHRPHGQGFSVPRGTAAAPDRGLERARRGAGLGARPGGGSRCLTARSGHGTAPDREFLMPAGANSPNPPPSGVTPAPPVI
jgi:amino acid transporter